MIGVVIVTHCRLAHALIEAAEFILGCSIEAIEPVSVDISENAEEMREKISKGIKTVNQKKGILVLTDMFGGTPSNLSYSFLEEGRLEVISGVNLPLLIKAVNSREKMNLPELSEYLEGFGKKSISLASGMLKGNKRS